MLWLLFADDVSGLLGGSGWAGAGLLGLVLGWLLLKGLPDQSRQTKELTEAKDKQIDQLIQAKDAAVEKLTTAFKDAQIKAIDTFATVHEKSQDEFTKRNDKALESFMEISREERKVCQQWHEENRGRHEENQLLLNRVLAEQKENRHMLANVFHEAGLKKAAEGHQAQKRIYSENIGDTPPPESIKK